MTAALAQVAIRTRSGASATSGGTQPHRHARRRAHVRLSGVGVDTCPLRDHYSTHSNVWNCRLLNCNRATGP
jgi:hypothetical protein